MEEKTYVFHGNAEKCFKMSVANVKQQHEALKVEVRFIVYVFKVNIQLIMH